MQIAVIVARQHYINFDWVLPFPHIHAHTHTLLRECSVTLLYYYANFTAFAEPTMSFPWRKTRWSRHISVAIAAIYERPNAVDHNEPN